MWILPKQLHTSAYVQDTEELISDYQELSEVFAQSVMWRSKLSQSRTWCQRLKRVFWMSRLFGRILKPSLGISFAKRWTSSLAASLVNLSARQEDEQETKTHATSGPTSSPELKGWDFLPLFSLKTLKELSLQNYAANGLMRRDVLFCFMSSVSWRDWVTRQRRDCLQRVKQGPLISEKESLSWGCKLIAKQYWLTPLTTNHRHQSISTIAKRTKKGKQLELQDQVTISLQAEGQNNLNGNHPEQLNPRWVETLMGLPVGWVMSSCVNPWIIESMNSDCLEMELFQPQQNEHLERSGVDWRSPVASDGEGGIMRHIKGSTGKYKLRDQVTWKNNGLPEKSSDET